MRLASSGVALGLLFWAAVARPVTVHANPVDARAFDVSDYFQVRRFTEVALSDDGRWLAYAVHSPAGGQDVEREFYLERLASSGDTGAVESLALPADAHGFAWIPDSDELAFLADRSGTTQILSRSASGAIRALTHSVDAIESFSFAPDGRSFAFATRRPADAGQSLYERFRQADRGIAIDVATTSSHDFLNPHWNALARPPPPQLWIQPNGGEPVRVPVPGEPLGDAGTYFWSSDSRRLSVTYVDAVSAGASKLGGAGTSVGVYAPGSSRFLPVAQAVQRGAGRVAQSFAGGEWVPNRRQLLVRRVTQHDPWVSDSFPDWAVMPAIEGAATDSALSWRAIEAYPRGLRFHPRSRTRALVENTVEGVHSLFELTPAGLTRSALMVGVNGSNSRFSMNLAHTAVAFVNESLTRPPELHLARTGRALVRLTNINDAVAARVRHRARELSWKSRDGTLVKGWLLEPADALPGLPSPLLTHVHGGPAFPFPDAFAPYFAYWPYPLEVYAARGIAVFLPNYRGTHTYGRRIAEGSMQQAMGDIATGIEHLVAAGIADRNRLGISGHSHGALLGPMTMGRERIFRAASFAEGVASSVVMYEVMSDDANREIHDALIGASLYDSPQLYLDDSPDLQFKGLATACLFEGGAYSAALLMLGFPKAALRAGAPAQFIVYPRTGHNLALPDLQEESARRNVEWFSRWLLPAGQ